jgi:hypothetical protein
MEKTYLPYDQDQLLLLPPSVREWVKPGDLAHLIDDVVECLDLSTVYEAELRGAPPYHPVTGADRIEASRCQPCLLGDTERSITKVAVPLTYSGDSF